MRQVVKFEAEDGSLWPSEESARGHEAIMRGELAPKLDVAYCVANVDGDWRAYKKLGGSVELLQGKHFNEADDAYGAILADIGYPCRTLYVDGYEWNETYDEPFFPGPEHFSPSVAIGEGKP